MSATTRCLADTWERLRLGAPPRLGPTGELALSLASRWNPDDMVAILTAYLGEAGTDGRYPFCVVGGYVSTVLKWNDFDIKWRRILKKNEVPYFHTMEYNANTPP